MRRKRPEDPGKGQELTALGEVLERLFHSNPDLSPEVFAIWKHWEEISGEEIAKVARPSSFKKGVLTVKVTDPIWIQELNLKKQELLVKIQQRIQKALIKDLRFTIGKY